MNKPDLLAQGIQAGDEQALARGLSVVENREEGWEALLERLYPESRRGFVLGVTGPPGGGKSTLVKRLVEEFRKEGVTVGVLAVDPTSPFSGGALLGDRTRMMDLAGKEGVFIRSMASRGALGGLNPGINDAVLLMEAFGSEVVIIETVGVGQAEIAITEVADMVVVVLVPGQGDEVQALKGGLLEIADLFVINKSDRGGAEELEIHLQWAVAGHEARLGRRPPIVKTAAIKGEGLGELCAGLREHRQRAAETALDEERSRRRADLALRAHLEERIGAAFLTPLLAAEEWHEAIERIARREISPGKSARRLLRKNFPDVWRCTRED